MKQTNTEAIKIGQELLKELAVKRGGTVLEFHKMMANDPYLLSAFSQMYDACNRDMKHIPKKYRELIIFAIGCAKGFDTQVAVHGKLAIENGASVEEIGEVLRMVFLACGVSAFHPGLQMFDPIDTE